VRLSRGEAQFARFAFQGAYKLEFFPSGGWLLKSVEETADSYCIPQSPVLRTIVSRARILSEQPARFVGFSASSTGVTIDIEVPNDTHLDCTFGACRPALPTLLRHWNDRSCLQCNRHDPVEKMA